MSQAKAAECECCGEPATYRDAAMVPLCGGCMKQLIYDWSQGFEEQQEVVANG